MCSICCWQIIDLDISFRRFSSVPFVVSGWEGWWWWWRCTFAVHKRRISWKMSADQIVVLKRGKFKKIADLNLLILFRLKQIGLNVFQVERNLFECFSDWNKFFWMFFRLKQRMRFCTQLTKSLSRPSRFFWNTKKPSTKRGNLT